MPQNVVARESIFGVRVSWWTVGELTISELRPSHWKNMQNTLGYKNILGLGNYAPRIGGTYSGGLFTT